MEIYCNKKEMKNFIEYVQNEMDNCVECNYTTTDKNKFEKSVFEYGFFLVNAEPEKTCKLFADLTFCSYIIKTDEERYNIDCMKYFLSCIIWNGLQKYNLHIN